MKSASNWPGVRSTYLRVFTKKLGEDIGFNRIGYMVITDVASTVDRVLELHRQNGIKSSKLSPNEIKKLVPHMNVDGIAAAGYEPDSGYADPFLTVAAMVAEGPRNRDQDVSEARSRGN